MSPNSRQRARENAVDVAIELELRGLQDRITLRHGMVYVQSPAHEHLVVLHDVDDARWFAKEMEC